MTERAQTYLRADEIARELGLSSRTIRRWIVAGILPSIRLGGARLVARADLERALLPHSSLACDSDEPGPADQA
jgi:excisionase family DNA binding protein